MIRKSTMNCHENVNSCCGGLITRKMGETRWGNRNIPNHLIAALKIPRSRREGNPKGSYFVLFVVCGRPCKFRRTLRNRAKT